jgi:murein DD-endopeptidase MepM/ murein hydrolase activator NlpD
LPENAADALICVKSFFTVPVKHKNRVRAVAAAAGFVIICAVAANITASKNAKAADFWANFPQKIASAETAVQVEPDYFESSYTIAAPFVTVTVEDPTLYEGDTAVLTEGRDGTRRITERVGYVDGEEVSRAAVENNVVLEPVDEVIAVGTAPRPLTASYGEYHNPADGKVTSGFGRRSLKIGSSNHQGIDIEGKKGDPIYAADGGVVIAAGDKKNGYGNMVQIQHDNGDITLYAHNSELVVAEGDLVYRGQQIAKMGSTGTASGVHCHFELRINGKPVNPAKYLPK